MDRTTLKSWFQRGKKPTASQFAALIDSFWHKDDTMSLHSIKGLNEALQTKAGINHDHDKEYSAIDHAHDQYLTEHQDITGKADKAVGAVAGNLATLDANGNPTDSGKKATDFAHAEHDHDEEYSAIDHTHNQYLTEHQDISGKQDKTDNSLLTTAKNVVSAINELWHKLTDYALTNHNHDGVYQPTGNYAADDHNHDEKYSPIGHEHPQYLTEHQDISGKQDQADSTLKTMAKTIAGAINELWDRIEDLWGKYIRGIDNVTHAELVAMRDAGELIAGRRYRIIDFVTTTSQPDTRSAGHRFDIIVTADTPDSINENARATKHVFTTEELAVPTYYLWTSNNNNENDAPDYGIITRVRVPQSIEDIVGRYTDDGEEYVSERMFGNYKELSYADESEMQLNWIFTTDEQPEEQDSGTDTYSFAEEITLDKIDDPEYFANSNLKAWKLKYCLDNDLTRFLYADTINGKGVIYYLEDEFGNKGDFDFKNIQHKRYKVADDSADGILGALDGLYVGYNSDMNDLIIEDTEDYIWAFPASIPSYTFNEEIGDFDFDMAHQQDATLNRLPEGTYLDEGGGGYAHPVVYCKGNKFVSRQVAMSLDDGTWAYPYRISNIVLFCYPKYFWGSDTMPARIELENCADNMFSPDSDFITANSAFARNTFLTASTNLIFGGSVGRSVFKGDCHHCTFGGYIGSTTFGGYIGDTTFGGNIEFSTFGGYIGDTTFGGSLSSCIFGGDIWRSTFGGYIGDTTFGGYIYGATFGGEIVETTFGGYIGSTTFGGNIGNTTFGGYIDSTTFGGNLSNSHIHGMLYNVTIGVSGETWSNLVLDPGIEYLTVTCSESGDGDVKNVHIYTGVCGTFSTPLEVVVSSRDNTLVEIKPASKTEILV